MTFTTLAKNNGIFLGIILIIFSLVLSFVNPAVFLKSRSLILIVPFFIILMKGAFDIRRLNEGFIDFKSLFIYSMLSSAIAISFCTIFEYFLFNFIFPDLKEVFRAISMEALEESGSLLGENYIDQFKENLNNDDLYNIPQMISLYFTRMIAPGALLSVMTALMFKKNQTISKN